MCWFPDRFDWPSWKEKAADPVEKKGRRKGEKQRHEAMKWSWQHDRPNNPVLCKVLWDISFCHLAWLAMHVESDHDAVCDFAGAAVHQVLSQPGSKVALTRSARSRQDDTTMFEKQTDIVLHHRFGNEGLEYQAVHTLLLQTWTQWGTSETGL